MSRSEPLNPPCVGEVARTWVGTEPVAVWNVDGRLYAVSDICPHRGQVLSEGGVRRDGDASAPRVVCPGHGWQFNLSSGQSTASPDTIRVFEIKTANGSIIVGPELPSGEAATGVSTRDIDG